jgi:hypothetical protein
MRPRKRQETGKQDLFGSRLDRIIDLTRTGEAFARDRLASPPGNPEANRTVRCDPLIIRNAPGRRKNPDQPGTVRPTCNRPGPRMERERQQRHADNFSEHKLALRARHGERSCSAARASLDYSPALCWKYSFASLAIQSRTSDADLK